MSDPVDDLYQRVPGEFVAARNQLVRELKKAGEKDRAAEVAKLRRPSVGAWAVNQLARRDRAELEELLRTGAHSQQEFSLLWRKHSVSAYFLCKVSLLG